MTTITHETKIGAVKSNTTAGKIQISNAKLQPYIGRKCKVTIEVNEIEPAKVEVEAPTPTIIEIVDIEIVDQEQPQAIQ